MLELLNVKFSYRVNKRIFSITTKTSVSNRRVSLDIGTDGDIFTAKLRSSSPVEIIRLSAEFAYDFHDDASLRKSNLVIRSELAAHSNSAIFKLVLPTSIVRILLSFCMS